MIAIDEDALICDLAETYHIFEYRSLPLHTVAAFSVGLRENSRIKMALAGTKYPFDTILFAAIYDAVNMQNWAISDNGRKGINPPDSIANKLLGRKVAQKESEYMLFDTAEAFFEMWNK